MNYNFMAKLNLFSAAEGGRAFYRASDRQLIGGIPFRLTVWETELTVTCFIVAPCENYLFNSPVEIYVPIVIRADDEYMSQIKPGSKFNLWEGRSIGEGVILERYEI